MKRHATKQQIFNSSSVCPRAYQVTISSQQVYILAQWVGTYNPDQRGWWQAFLFLEGCFLVTAERLKT